jgi:protein ImuB
VPRLACVDLPAFPLQVLLKSRPEWRGLPVAVVAEEKAQAPLLWVNEGGWRAGVRPGQRYAAALSLVRGLRAGTVSGESVQGEIARITEGLRRYTPEVEPAAGVPGLFWLDAAGLDRIHPSLEAWARGIRRDLFQRSFVASVVVGFTRFGTYAVAKARRTAVVFAGPGEEEAAARGVPLERLDVDPDVREALVKLGVRTVGDFVALPPTELRQRFGEDLYRLHRLARGDLWSPLQPAAPEEPRQRQEDLPAPDANSVRLLFRIKRLLDDALAELAARGEALVEVEIGLRLDRGGWRRESLRTAAPTLDAAQVLDLVRLRLDVTRLGSPAVELALTVGVVPATSEQLRLFEEQQSRRDLAAAGRAFARLRAEMGEGAVVRARLRDAHLPGARFEWERLDAAVLPHPRPVSPRPLVRRIFAPPRRLPPRPRHEPDGWLLRGEDHGAVSRFIGPYLLSGGWWGGEVRRDYYFAQMRRGDVLWVYYDRRRRRWYLEGQVE